MNMLKKLQDFYQEDEYSDIEPEEIRFEDEYKARERAGGPVYKVGERICSTSWNKNNYPCS